MATMNQYEDPPSPKMARNNVSSDQEDQSGLRFLELAFLAVLNAVRLAVYEYPDGQGEGKVCQGPEAACVRPSARPAVAAGSRIP